MGIGTFKFVCAMLPHEMVIVSSRNVVAMAALGKAAARPACVKNWKRNEKKNNYVLLCIAYNKLNS